MSGVFKSRLLVLRRRVLGEHDEVLTCLSPTHGLLDCAVRGSRRITSTLTGLVEPFTELNGLLAHGKQWDYLTQAQVASAHGGLRSDLGGLCWAAYLCDLANVLLEFGTPAHQEFELLRLSLEALEGAGTQSLGLVLGGEDDSVRKIKVVLWFELNFWRLLGYAPELQGCVHCGQDSPFVFSVAGGGLVCRSCSLARPEETDRPLSLKTWQLLKSFSRCSCSMALRLSMSMAQARQCEELMWEHLQYHNPCRIKSRQVLLDCSEVVFRS